MMFDSEVLAHNFKNDLAFLANNWTGQIGRPTVILMFNSSLLGGNSADLSTLGGVGTKLEIQLIN